MARIVFAWELGGDYGHLSRLLPLALEMKRLGHDPVFVARDLGCAEQFLGPHGIAWFQAPLWGGQVNHLPEASGYAELLMRFGFLNARALTGIARAWRNLLATLRADMLVMDHAPTAMLATRGLPLRRVNLGDGFCIPPAVSPLPLFLWWQRGNAVRQLDSEERVRQTANAVLVALGAPPLQHLHELFSADLLLMCTFAELDHYPGRGPTDFSGPAYALGQGASADWPQGEGPRVFAYLKAGYIALDRALESLRDAPLRILAHVPGASRDTLRRFSSASLCFSEAPVDIEAARLQCDIALCHGGQGTTTAMLLAGKPLVLLPMHMEQAITAYRLETLGVATSLLPAGAAQCARLLKRMGAEAGFARAASAFAQAHAEHDQVAVVAGMATRCIALLERT